MPDALLITVAPTGAETAKADCPQLPTTPEELPQTMDVDWVRVWQK